MTKKQLEEENKMLRSGALAALGHLEEIKAGFETYVNRRTGDELMYTIWRESTERKLLNLAETEAKLANTEAKLAGYIEANAKAAGVLNELGRLRERDTLQFDAALKKLREEKEGEASNLDLVRSLLQEVNEDRVLFRAYVEKLFKTVNEIVRSGQQVNGAWILSDLAVLFNQTETWLETK